MDLINRLHSTGVKKDIDLPVIAVIGSQSVGKSSLIESISGITLPRSSGTCTRCPTECKLSYSKEPWHCTVSLRFETDEHGEHLGQARNVAFGEIIYDKAGVEDRIRRAQRAVLNPATTSRHFLDDDDETGTIAGQLAFTTNSICLQITGPDVADLSFVDLPGLIASVSQGGNVRDIQLVEELVNKYIKKPSCIILLTVTCEVDFETQGAYRLAMEADPERKRIVGALTKPDRIPPEEENNWLRYIRNEKEPLDNGWYCVKLPGTKDLTAGISWEDARAAEDHFFSYTSPWSTLDPYDQKHLRTRNLTERLSDLLSQLIAKRLPEIQDELQCLLRRTEESIRELPSAPSADPVSEVLHMIGNFMRQLSMELEGTPEETGLLQKIQPAHETFKKAIRTTAPNFRADVKRSRPSGSFFGKGRRSASDSDIPPPPMPPPDFLIHEDGEIILENQSRVIYIDEVMDRAKKAVTRELPDKYPFMVTKLFIKEITRNWTDPAMKLFDVIHNQLFEHVKKLVVDEFGRYAESGLQARIMLIVADHVQERKERTRERIEWLLRLEEKPFTLNAHYYMDYKDKFLAYYKGYRQKSQNTSLMSQLGQGRATDPYDESEEMVAPLNDLQAALAALVRLGFQGVKAEDLPKLLPPDPFAPAIEIMAETRAYFQVAYKRVTDNVPLAIDHELVRGLEQGLEEALYRGLSIGGSEASSVCRALTQEPINVSARREELVKKRERLESAKAELLGI